VSEATEHGDVLNRAGMLAGRIADNSAVAVQQCIRTLRMKEVRHSFAIMYKHTTTLLYYRLYENCMRCIYAV
jgi:hypothetical protein